MRFWFKKISLTKKKLSIFIKYKYKRIIEFNN